MRRATGERLAVVGPAAYQPPREREDPGGDGELDCIADDERGEAHGNGVARRQVERDCQPRHAYDVDDDLAEDHRANGAADMAIPAHLGQPANKGPGEEEADQVAADR